ncbi:MAG: class I SAM-dependent methyltransferase [Chloroflexi bacterium]|nr:class I SAM-dependent methyltransferase [Chloroflexota bacterium]
MSTDQIKQSYEAIPYPDLCYTQTHPDRLATLATLLGLKPAPVTRCRVLELGCAIGGNLIPMAYGLPDSEFVGIDLSPRQIDMGQTAVRDLALSNISLHAADIMDIGPEWGRLITSSPMGCIRGRRRR